MNSVYVGTDAPHGHFESPTASTPAPGSYYAKGDEEVPPWLDDGRARGPAACLWLVVALPREYRPRQPPTAAPLSNLRLAA